MKLWKLFGKSHSDSDGFTSPTKPSISSSTEKIRYNGINRNWADKIEFAFTSGGTNYFRLISEPYIPYNRANAALDIYEELEWGISPAFLQKHIQAVDSILTDPKTKTKEALISKLAVIVSQLKERMNLATSLTLRMRLATVLYFDEFEDITTYNYQYGVQKIKHWTENHDVEEFFFRLPILDFLPSLHGWQGNLETLIRAEAIEGLQSLQAVTMLTMSEETSPELQNLLESQEAVYQLLRNWKK